MIVKVSIVKMLQYFMFNCPVTFLSGGSLNNAKTITSPPTKVLECCNIFIVGTCLPRKSTEFVKAGIVCTK